MVSEIVALVVGGLIGAAPATYLAVLQDRALQRAEVERQRLLDRIQAPEMVWPQVAASFAEDPLAPPSPEGFDYDDTGLISDPVWGDG